MSMDKLRRIFKFTTNMVAKGKNVASLWGQGATDNPQHCVSLITRNRSRSGALANHRIIKPPPIAASATFPVLSIERLDYRFSRLAHNHYAPTITGTPPNPD